jgi:hypothetical protein
MARARGQYWYSVQTNERSHLLSETIDDLQDFDSDFTVQIPRTVHVPL